ncbi:MAG TPA: hypothetical protein VGC62_09190 [Pseudomonas sp.]|uniref:hypothetical protein n=1 Tax=Pseudomonas sp. TaxID=306 RepID=UPI002ED86859
MPATDRITLVLKPHAGTTIEELQRYAKLGMPVGVGRALGVIAGAHEGDVAERTEQLENQVILAEAAMRRGALMRDQDHLPAIRRVIDHVPTLYLAVADQVKQSALDDGDDLAMAEEAAGQAIRVLVMFKQRLEKLLEPDLFNAPGVGDVAGVRQVLGQFIATGDMGVNEARNLLASVDKDHVNQISGTGENVNQTTQIPGSLITENPVIAESMHIDDRIRAVAAEASFLTVVFKLPNIQAAAPLIDLLPYGRKALGTEAEVFGLTTGNLMEGEPCAD